MGCFDSVGLPPHFAQHDRVERIPLSALNARPAAFVLLSHSSLLRAEKCGGTEAHPALGRDSEISVGSQSTAAMRILAMRSGLSPHGLPSRECQSLNARA
jgi:hypothetical protein